MFHHKVGKIWTDFQNSFTTRFLGKRFMYSSKNFHFLWNALPHYLVKVYYFRETKSWWKSKPTWKLKHAISILETRIFLPNVVKIDPCNFELHRFKVGAFLRHSVHAQLFRPLSVQQCFSSDELTGLGIGTGVSAPSWRQTAIERKSNRHRTVLL